MLRLAFILTALLGFKQSLWAFDHKHSDWAKTLSEYREEPGLVRYAKLKVDAKDSQLAFNRYLGEIQTVSKAEYERWTKLEREAFLINAYNALTIKLIIDHYPVASIKKIGGLLGNPWQMKFFKLLDGSIETLDAIEHAVLRPQFKDYRIHAAVNCASQSCPVLRAEAYQAEKLDAQLTEQMQLWLKDSSRNLYDVSRGELKLSKIFDWYVKDFDSWGGGVPAVIRRHGPELATKTLENKGKISYLDYDWSLNQRL